MKRFISFLLILTLTAGAVSCKGKNEKKSEIANDTLTIENTNSGKPIHLTRAEFLKVVYDFEKSPKEFVYNGDKPAIIDFYADWCAPCKKVAPILDKLAKEYEGKIYIYKIDTEAEQQLAAEFGIQSIPTMLFIPMNEQPQAAVGALPEESLRKAIEEVLLKNGKL